MYSGTSSATAEEAARIHLHKIGCKIPVQSPILLQPCTLWQLVAVELFDIGRSERSLAC